MNDIFAKDLSGEMVSPDEPGYDELIILILVVDVVLGILSMIRLWYIRRNL